MSRTSAWRKRSEQEEGQDLIEFALILPVLTLVVLALVEFGILFWSYNSIANAAREGARRGVAPGVTVADVEARIETGVTGLPRDPACATLPCLTYTVEGVPSGSVITVTLAYSTTLLTGPIISAVGGSGAITLRAGARMNRE